MVNVGEEGVPKETTEVDAQDSVLDRDVFEVQEVDEGPGAVVHLEHLPHVVRHIFEG